MRLDKALLDLAEEQRSCIANWQVRELGASSTEWTRLRSSRLWTPLGRHVLALSGVPHDDLLRTSAAVLAAGPGAVLSHTSAAALWGLPGFRLLPITLSQRRGRATRPGPLGDVHDLVLVPERWVTRLEAIRVVRPELLLYQLCGVLDPRHAARTFDNAWSRRLLSGRSAKACLVDLAQRGRDGTVVYREIIKARGDDYIPPTTNLESRVMELGEEAGIKLRRQVDLGGEHWDGRVDFLEEDVRLVVEVQSEKYHSALLDVEADGARREQLEADGFSWCELWDHDVWTRRAWAVNELRAATRAAKSHWELHKSV